MSIDNRTTLNDCSAVFTGGDDTGAVITTVGSYYEGGSALSVQFTNADERSYTTNIGGTKDLSDSQCWLLIKDNLVQTQALGGIKYVLFDGINEIGYEVGGNDNTGLSLSTFWNSYRLDVSNSAVFTGHAFAGSEVSLSKAAITGVGYGTQHLAKAVGSTDNCQIDRLSFIVNGSPALTINGGTVGVPINLTTVSSDDITNGWGLVSNPQGKQYNIFCSTEFGDSGTSDSYFEIVDSQVTLNGIGVGSNNFDMDVIANATGTNSFKIENSVVVNIGAKSNWTVSNNIDVFDLNSAQFVDNGNFVFPTSAVNRSVINSSWSGCGTTDISTISPSNCNWSNSGQIDTTNGGVLTDCKVSSTTVLSAILSNDLSQVSNVEGVSSGSNHHVELNSIGGGSMTWDNVTSGYDAGATGSPITPTATGNEDLFVNVASGTLTVNVAAGATIPSIRSAGAIINVVAGLVALSIETQSGNEVRIRQGSFTLQHNQSVTGGVETYSYTYSAGTKVTISVGNAGFIRQVEKDFELPSADASRSYILDPDPSYIP